MRKTPTRSEHFIGLAVWVLSAWLGGCSPDAGGQTVTTPGSSSGVDACAQGASRACFCPDGSEHQQECQPGGTLAPCPCDSDQGPGPEPGGPSGPNNGDDMSSGGTGGGGEAPSGPAALCPELRSVGACSEPAAFQAEELPAYLMFVVDRSGSMRCNPPPLQSSAVCEEEADPADPNLPTKWTITMDVLRDVIHSLADQGLNAGLTMFPTDTACGVDSDPLAPVALLSTAHAQTLTHALDLEIAQPRGLTPLVGAATLAYRHLHDELQAQGNRFVVLLTDGFETCAEDQMDHLLDVELPKSRQAFIRTFVIGVPGAEPGRGLLSELAYRGGTARTEDCFHPGNAQGDVGDCHYDMTLNPETFGEELREALAEIGSQALGCEFPVPQDGSEAPSEDNVNVQYFAGGDGEPICLAPDFERPCSDPDHGGWRFAQHPDGSADLSRVVVCGQACDVLRQDAQARVEVIVGCPPLILL